VHRRGQTPPAGGIAEGGTIRRPELESAAATAFR
jgi:hypothetical protein